MCSPFPRLPWQPNVLELLLYCPSPWVFGSAPLAGPLRVPREGLPGDVYGRFPQGMSNPSPLPSPNGDFYPFLLCTLPQVLINFEILLGHQIPMMYRSLRLMNVWSLEMILLVNLQVSDPYRRTALTFELKILSLVHREMHLDLQTGLNMQKAACAFLHLAHLPQCRQWWTQDS